MKTIKGEIYFVREIEAGIYSPHTKIGLIEDGENRTSLDRVAEHQTANPRKLVIVYNVKTECVRAVETYLHRKYARLRGMGEWFQLDESSLDAAIHFCDQLSSRFAKEIAVLELSKNLKDKPSDGELITASDESNQWFQKLVMHSSLLKECNRIKASYEALVREFESTGVDTTQNADIRTAAREILNEKGFKEKYDELWRQHTKEIVTISGRFVVGNIKKSEVDLAALFPEFNSLRERFTEALDSGEDHSIRLDLMKGCYLELLGFINEANIEKDIAEAHLKVLCGTSGGIDGICKWKRTEETSFKLDKQALKANYPSEYKEFVTVSMVESFVAEKAQREVSQ